MPSTLQYHYRNKITLHFKIINQNIKIGFIEKNNFASNLKTFDRNVKNKENIFSLHSCPIFTSNQFLIQKLNLLFSSFIDRKYFHLFFTSNIFI